MLAIHALIAVKELSRAKSRLAPGLSPADRKRLVLAMLADTVTAARGVDAIQSVTVVTPDPSVMHVARGLGADVLADPPCRRSNGSSAQHELNVALASATDRVRATLGAVDVMVLQADLPALRTRELADAIDIAPFGRSIVIDHHGSGTSALFLRDPRALLRPMFGSKSAIRHIDDGAVALQGCWPGLRLDVDTVDDLLNADRLGVGDATRVVLSDIRLAV